MCRIFASLCFQVWLPCQDFSRSNVYYRSWHLFKHSMIELFYPRCFLKSSRYPDSTLIVQYKCRADRYLLNIKLEMTGSRWSATYCHLKKLPSTHHFRAILFLKILLEDYSAPEFCHCAKIKLLPKPGGDELILENFCTIARTHFCGMQAVQQNSCPLTGTHPMEQWHPRLQMVLLTSIDHFHGPHSRTQ